MTHPDRQTDQLNYKLCRLQASSRAKIEGKWMSKAMV